MTASPARGRRAGSAASTGRVDDGAAPLAAMGATDRRAEVGTAAPLAEVTR